MNNNKLTTFKKFNSSYTQKKLEESEIKTSKKLMEVTDKFHNEQLKLQELQKQYVGTLSSKELRQFLQTKEIFKKDIVHY